MIGRLVTLPLRLGNQVLRLYLAGGRRAVSLVREFLEAETGMETGTAAARPPEPPRAAPPPPHPVAPPPPVPPPTRPPPPAPTVLEPEPVEPPHVSEEPELVAESADPEAADPATAEVHVAEPWEGYRRMKAEEIVTRIAAATAEELAVVELYEHSHRRRKSVVAAAERQMRVLANRP